MRLRPFLTSGECNNLKRRVHCADAPDMPTANLDLWFIVAGITSAGVVAVLLTLARQIEHERSVVDLRKRIVEVRQAYAQRLTDQRSGEILEVAPVEDEDSSARLAA